MLVLVVFSGDCDGICVRGGIAVLIVLVMVIMKMMALELRWWMW